MEFELCSLPCRSFKQDQSLCIYVVLYKVYVFTFCQGNISSFFWVLIDLIIELLDLIIKGFDNQTDIFIDLRLIIKPFDNQSF